MKNSNLNYSRIQNEPRHLWFLVLTYSMVLSISNWYDARLIEIFGLATSPGALAFPITFLISDLITEVYGYKYARRAIHVALLFNTLFILYGQLIISLPSPAFAEDNEAFRKLLSFNKYVILASFVSYIVSEPLNSLIVSKLKVRLKGQFRALRFFLSTFFASLVDSFSFSFIAFSKFYSLNKVAEIAFTIWLLKSFIELLGLPLSLKLTKVLNNIEQIDNYDTDTNYSIFSLDTQYSNSNNHYEQ